MKSIRTDGAKEFNSKEIKFYFTNNGTCHQTSPPFSPESNSRIERANRTKLERARTILSDFGKISKADDYLKFWPEAVNCAIHTHNRVLTKSSHKDLKYKTPYEIITKDKPDISYFRIFGSKVKVLKFDGYHTSKFEPKTWTGYHMGYKTSKIYRIYIPDLGRIIESQDVEFFESLEEIVRERRA